MVEGVDTIFGIPGAHNVDLFDALIDHPRLKVIIGRHEQDMAFMANGYGRATGSVAGLLVITGPGLTNSLTAVADAYGDSVPMLVVTASPHQDYEGKGAFHELKNQTALLASVTKWNTLVGRAEDVPAAIQSAASRAVSGRPGPTAVEIPCDVQSRRTVIDILAPAERERSSADLVAVSRAARLLSEARRPIVYLGECAVECAAEVIRLIELLNAPCFGSSLAQGIVPTGHPLFLNDRSVQRGPAHCLLEEADAMVAIGTTFGEVETDAWTLPLPTKLVQIDACGELIGHSYPVSVGLVGDPLTVLRQLLAELASIGAQVHPSPLDRIAEIKQGIIADGQDKKPWLMVNAIARALPCDAFVTNDASMSNAWILAHLPRCIPRTMSITRNMAALGFALPAALGAKVAFPDRQALAVTGDGGFLFTSNAIATAVEYRLNVAVMIYRDNCYSAVKGIQLREFGRTVGVELKNPDFVRLAEALGAIGMRVDQPEQLHEALDGAWSRDLPTIIDVPGPLRSDIL